MPDTMQPEAAVAMHRIMPIEVRAVGDDGVLEFAASSEQPVERWGEKEVLSHADGAVRLERLRGLGALLVNHDPGQRAGSIVGADVGDGQLRVRVKFLSTARGQELRTEVEEGALRGVSIGYRIHAWSYDEDTDTLTATDWEPYEVSLTPIPADPTVGVGRSEDADRWRSLITHAAAPAAKREGAATMPNTQDPAAGNAAEPDHADAAEQARQAQQQAEQAAQRAQLELQLTRHAQAFGIMLSAEDLQGVRTIDDGLALIQKRHAAANRAPDPETGGPTTGDSHIRVAREDTDKLRARGVCSLLSMAGMDAPQADHVRKGSPLALVDDFRHDRPMDTMALIGRCAEQDGVVGARDWDRMRLAQWALDRSFYVRDAAMSKITSNFTSILATAAEIALMGGFGAKGEDLTWDTWCTVAASSSFQAEQIAALASGRLSEVEENEAIPELTQADGGYTHTLAMYAAGITVTLQALVNDRLGEFLQSVARRGSIAAETVEYNAFYALLNATWTNDTSASSGLGTAGNLDKTRTAHLEKLDPAGNKMGNHAKYLLHDPVKAQAAEQDTGAIYAPGALTVPARRTRAIMPIESSYVGDTGLLSSVNTTDYYLVSDPRMVDTVRVSFLNGQRSPMFAERDPGMVAGRRFVVMLPHKATVATHTDSASNARVSGITKATA